MKKPAVTFSILLLVGFLAGCASGDRWQDIRWNGDLNMIQAAELNSLEQKFCSDSVKLRKEIRATSEELISTQLNTSDTDSKKVKALQAELRHLLENGDTISEVNPLPECVTTALDLAIPEVKG